MAEQLHVKVVGEGDGNIVLLHGLFGSGNNLGRIARGLRADFRVASIDLPDHGRSQWLPSSSIQSYAKHVAAWIDEEKLRRCHVIGHSLGGKVAMQLAVNRPDLIDQLVVLDISPAGYTIRRHDHIFAGLNAVRASRVESRAAARAILLEHVHDEQIADFLLTSGYIDDSGVIDWRFNLRQLHADYRNMLSGIEVQEARGLPCDSPVLLVRGAESDYVANTTKQDFAHLFSALNVVTVKNAGHWLHQEQTATVLDIIRKFCAP